MTRSREVEGRPARPSFAAITTRHLRWQVERPPEMEEGGAGGWVEAAGGDGGALDLAVPLDVVGPEAAFAGLVMPEINEHRCQRPHGAVVLGGHSRLGWFPCQCWACANFRWWRARGAARRLVEVLGPESWLGLLHGGGRAQKTFSQAVTRAGKVRLSRECVSSPYQCLCSTYTENCHNGHEAADDTSCAGLVPGYVSLSPVKGSDRRIVVTNVDVNSRDRRLAHIDPQHALDYIVRRIAAGPVGHLDWSRSWRPPKNKPAGFAVFLGSDPDNVDAIIRLAGFTPVYDEPDEHKARNRWTGRERRLANIVTPPGMSNEEARAVLEATKDAYYESRKPQTKPRRKSP